MLCTDINMVIVTVGCSGLNFMGAILGCGGWFVNGNFADRAGPCPDDYSNSRPGIFTKALSGSFFKSFVFL